MGVIHEQQAAMMRKYSDALTTEIARRSCNELVNLNFVLGRTHESWFYQLNDEVNAEKTVNEFHLALSRSCTSRRCWKAHKTMLVMAGGLERQPSSGRLHAHLEIKRPDWMAHEDFVGRVKKVAKRNPWILNGEHNVKVIQMNPIDDDDEEVNDQLHRYVVKERNNPMVIWYS